MVDRQTVKPADRAAPLRARQSLKMTRSAHAYVRGSTANFYQWLGEHKRGTLPEGPPVWICGDCHVGNLGPVASSDGRVSIQIRDFDQTVIGNPAHDIVRLALSLATACRGSNLPGVTIARILERVIEGYQDVLLRDVDAVDETPEAVTASLKLSLSRSWKHLARERLEDLEPAIPLGAKFWPLSAAERSGVKALFAGAPLRQLASSLKSRDDDADVEVLDAAYWIKGCSSLGRLRIAVLCGIGAGKKRELALMDLKEAVAPDAPRALNRKMPKNNAERVVAGAVQLAPHLGHRMIAAKVGTVSVFVRELLPQDLKLEIEQLTIAEAQSCAYFLAQIVGKAHGRQMDDATRSAWAATLDRSWSKSLEAPSWLWSSVVSLIGSHELAYLEHCRKYAKLQSAQ